MSEQKVYCKDCRWLSYGFHLGYYDAIKMRHPGKCHETVIHHCRRYTQPLCSVNMESKTEEISSYLKKVSYKFFIVDDPYIWNRNNNCEFYRRKWWKFWVSKGAGMFGTKLDDTKLDDSEILERIKDMSNWP